jgi:hypothetical protein
MSKRDEAIIQNARQVIAMWKEGNITNITAWQKLTGQEIASSTARKYLNAIDNFINYSKIDKIDNVRLGIDFERHENKFGETIYVQKSTMLVNIESMTDKTPNDLMILHGYDPLQWKMIKSENKAWNGTSKAHGTYTMFSSSIKVEPIQSELTTDQIKKIFDEFESPEVTDKTNIKSNKNKIMYEFGLVDFHLGLYAWHEETGENYDIDIAIETAKRGINDILSRMENCEKILLPIGQDFFHIDNEKNTTTKGTPQSVDTRWQKIFREGCSLNVWFIKKLFQKTNKIQINYVKSNHDQKLSYFLVCWLDAYFRNDNRIDVNLSPYPRQYIQWGKCGICLLHDLPKKRIDKIFQAESPEIWGNTKFRELHKGHTHNEAVQSEMGVTIRTIAPITPRCDWTTEKGFYSERKFQCFKWHKEKGLRQIVYSSIE